VTVLRQRVGELVHWVRDQSIGEDEVQAALTVEFAGGERLKQMERVMVRNWKRIQ